MFTEKLKANLFTYAAIVAVKPNTRNTEPVTFIRGWASGKKARKVAEGEWTDSHAYRIIEEGTNYTMPSGEVEKATESGVLFGYDENLPKKISARKSSDDGIDVLAGL